MAEEEKIEDRLGLDGGRWDRLNNARLLAGNFAA